MAGTASQARGLLVDRPNFGASGSDQGRMAGLVTMVLSGTAPLTIYIFLIILLPQRWVLPGLGAAGRPAGVFALGMLVMWLVAQCLPLVESAKTPLRWPLLFFALAFLVSYGLAFDRGLPGAEARAIDRAALGLLSSAGVILMASEGLASFEKVVLILRRLVAVSSAAVATALVQFFTGIDIFGRLRLPGLVLNSEVTDLTTRGAGGLVRAKGATLHPIEFGVLMGMVLPLAAHLALHEKNPRSRLLLFGAVALHISGGMLAVSRSAVLSLAAACIALALVWSFRMWLRAAVAGVVLLAGLQVMSPGLLGTIRSLFSNWNNDPSIKGRTDDYAVVGRYITDRPWFGRGPGTFLPSEYIVLDNAYLLRAIDSGLVGLGAYLLLVGFAFALLWSVYRRHFDAGARHVAAALAGSLFAAVVTSVTFDFPSFPTVTGVHLLVIGLAGSLFRLRNTSLDRPSWSYGQVLRR